jgi:hypothetical protein
VQLGSTLKYEKNISVLLSGYIDSTYVRSPPFPITPSHCYWWLQIFHSNKQYRLISFIIFNLSNLDKTSQKIWMEFTTFIFKEQLSLYLTTSFQNTNRCVKREQCKFKSKYFSRLYFFYLESPTLVFNEGATTESISLFWFQVSYNDDDDISLNRVLKNRFSTFPTLTYKSSQKIMTKGHYANSEMVKHIVK